MSTSASAPLNEPQPVDQSLAAVPVSEAGPSKVTKRGAGRPLTIEERQKNVSDKGFYYRNDYGTGLEPSPQHRRRRREATAPGQPLKHDPSKKAEKIRKVIECGKPDNRGLTFKVQLVGGMTREYMVEHFDIAKFKGGLEAAWNFFAELKTINPRYYKLIRYYKGRAFYRSCKEAARKAGITIDADDDDDSDTDTDVD